MDVSSKLSSIWGRIALGWTAVASVGILLWPVETWTFDVEKAVAAAGAVVAWMWADLSSANPSPRQHDLALFERFKELYSEEEKALLREQDFGDSFIYKSSEGLRTIAAWTGAAYEFVDHQIQRKWAPALQKVSAFID